MRFFAILAPPGVAAPPWNLSGVIGQLRLSREVTHHIRHRERIRELPSKTALIEILDGLAAVLFPTHFGRPNLTDESIDYFVGDTLNTTLTVLREQVRRALLFGADQQGLAADQLQARALRITREFTEQLPALTGVLVSDLQAAFQGDPAHLLQWVPLEAGIYRVNRVKDASSVTVDCSARDQRVLPETFVDYVENPRAYQLSAVTTVVEVHTRISDLYRNPYNQIAEQLRLTVEIIKERQESELINNKEYGLLHSIAPNQRIKTSSGAPTPDDPDDLLRRFGLESTVRPALAFYNNCADVDALVAAVQRVNSGRQSL